MAGNVYPTVTSRNNNYYEKGDYLCLREVTVGYTLPANLLRKIKIASLRVNVTGSNLGYLTKFRGPMPEDGGGDNGRYPNPRTLTIGVKASF